MQWGNSRTQLRELNVYSSLVVVQRAESIEIELQTAQEECTVMHAEVTAKTATIEERETKLAEMKGELEGLQNEVADAEAQEEYDALLKSIEEEERECNELEANLAQRQRDLKAREQVLTEALEQLRSQRRSTSRLSDGPSGSDDGECLQEEDETERDIRMSELRLKLESQKMELAVQKELRVKNERLIKDLEDRIQYTTHKHIVFVFVRSLRRMDSQQEQIIAELVPSM
ncbi:tropomyosin, putative [Perkinsus marinus ATCC 50983]|uniref:Tropomyosin, putative n=1 Tax=Perkinsus marinus (strain ATCC 50983 / TXsc) TaxID=423536 RepID=C5LLJ3_PERM5|nr:tropomyosin, putative [Perkinsus marinus ATCC 50983]EER02400.1 tropomyosin, putative [Perkinsus marinus ATCC 50983]|eukprot:XP_002769682.1 tropomyosin, putative [Perkinsus marinus ATCC 50983]